ncbi:MAG TPA: helix-turn-helix domain-containing protein [Casimicrobiaceae bacterium]|jgi:DNA-binding transcriptional ArsR family regulator
MKDGPSIARVAALIGDHARAETLAALAGGQALTATELANVAGVTKQTISGHLAKLVGARLVAVESQGRHRYFRLADRDVGELLEKLMGVAYRVGAVRVRTSPREPKLRFARVCYDHLAGELGVLAFDSLAQRGLLKHARDDLVVTRNGRAFWRDLGIELDDIAPTRRLLCRPCLDWSMRRHHLAGALGAALLHRMFELNWARREKDSRIVTFSAAGERAFRERFSLAR